MARLILLCFLAIFWFGITSDAATYVVGDTSGWDISTDMDSWASDKSFKVGDVLMFQYSSYHSVSEVTKESFDSCNTTDTLSTFSSGNTTVTLNKAGARYFVCGNKLHCLGGMKLRVNVEGDQASTSAAPQAQPTAGTTLPQPSSKSNNPSTVIPTSSGHIIMDRTESPLIALLFLTATMLCLGMT